MNLKKGIGKFLGKTKEHSAELLVGCEICGVVAVGWMAFKAGLKCDKIIKEHKEKMKSIKKDDTKAKRKLMEETTKKIAPNILPAAVIGAATIACIVGGYKATSKKIAILTAAYNLSEKAVGDLNNKMVEMLGEKDARKIKDAIVKDKMDKDFPKDQGSVILTGNGDVLCKDAWSGRYFKSNAGKIEEAVRQLSYQCMSEMFVSLNDLYYLLKIEDTPMGDDFGWNVDNIGTNGKLPITLSVHMGPDNTPCLCIDYDAHLRSDYRNLR